jgi:hypothetical protein
MSLESARPEGEGFSWVHLSGLRHETSIWGRSSVVALTDAGTYKAGVRNAAGEVLSSAALLTVHPAPIPKLNLKREINGRLTFTWTGTAKLMWSPSVSGPFNLVPGAVSGYQALPGTGNGFYRLGL